MQTIESSIVIDAPPATVWAVLTDGEGYEHWNPFVTSVTGDLAEDSRPRITVAPPGRRAMTFRPLVTHAVPDTRLRWIGTLGFRGLCDAEHEFILSPTPVGGTMLVQRETFRGLLVPLLGGMLEPTRRGFEMMNMALRDRAMASQHER